MLALACFGLAFLVVDHVAEFVFRFGSDLPPRDRPYAIGLDVNWVAQRQYTQNIGTLGYSVVTGQASLYLDLPVWNLYTVVRGGRYLAGDWGGTIEMGRRFDSGIDLSP